MAFSTANAQKIRFYINNFLSECYQIPDLVTFTEEILNGKLHILYRLMKQRVLVFLRTCLHSVLGVSGCLSARLFYVLVCLLAYTFILFLLILLVFYLHQKLMFCHEKIAVLVCTWMLIDVILKVEIVKNNNKDQENFFRNIFNPLLPKISKWSDTLSKSDSKWS